MKEIKEVTNCEQCGGQIELQSPPLHEYYQRGRIDIKSGTLLLDVKDRPGHSVAHSADLAGYYCDLNCFLKHVQSLRKVGGKRR